MGSEPLRRTTPSRARTFDRLQVLLGGYEITQLLYVLAELRIPDLLAAGPLTSEELALATTTEPDALRRVLRATASVGVLKEEDGGRFAITDLGGRLREDAPGSLRPLALSYGQPWRWLAWSHLLDAVRDGATAFEHAHGVPLYRFLAEDPGAAADFNSHMAALAEERGRALAGAYDFSRARRVVDVGGGRGALAETLLREYDSLSAVVVDSPAAVHEGQQRLRAAGLADRVTFTAGNFFDAVPAEGDVYVLSNVLHDWQDEEALAILRSCRAAMTRSARLLVLQDLAPPHGERSVVNVFDISLLVLTGGRERTLDAYRELLSTARFSLQQVVETVVGTSLLVAAPH
jgi:2-polyprenyl-3-methyl-5-hydroxy-6-metoxy-1,4-benzoquinol methylase